jgi:hypothetical protein
MGFIVHTQRIYTPATLARMREAEIVAARNPGKHRANSATSPRHISAGSLTGELLKCSSPICWRAAHPAR